MPFKHIRHIYYDVYNSALLETERSHFHPDKTIRYMLNSSTKHTHTHKQNLLKFNQLLTATSTGPGSYAFGRQAGTMLRKRGK